MKVGWTVGTGVEDVVSGDWTAKIEYLYIDLGNVSGSFTTPIVAPGGAFLTRSYNSHITDNILRVGLNYKLGGPVIAQVLSPADSSRLIKPGNTGAFSFLIPPCPVSVPRCRAGPGAAARTKSP